jgi:hypothetical protein
MPPLDRAACEMPIKGQPNAHNYPPLIRRELFRPVREREAPQFAGNVSDTSTSKSTTELLANLSGHNTNAGARCAGA